MSATLAGYINVTPHKVLNVNGVWKLHNNDTCFDPNLGIYTVDKEGHYFISIYGQWMPGIKDDKFEIKIIKNGQVLAGDSKESLDKFPAYTSCCIGCMLKHSDRIWVQCYYYSTRIEPANIYNLTIDIFK